MMTASVADDDVTAAANGVGYPFRFMAGIRIEPRAATSATADPEISAKNRDAPMLTIESPPRTNPNSAEAKAISRREIPDAFMMAPARMKSGMAMRGKVVAPSNSTTAIEASPAGPDVTTMATTATTPRATAIGTSMLTRATRPTRRSVRVMRSALPHRFLP